MDLKFYILSPFKLHQWVLRSRLLYPQYEILP